MPLTLHTRKKRIMHKYCRFIADYVLLSLPEWKSPEKVSNRPTSVTVRSQLEMRSVADCRAHGTDCFMLLAQLVLFIQVALWRIQG